MKKRAIYRLLIVLIIALTIILLNSNIVFAKINTNITISNRLINEAAPIGNRIVGALQVIGIFISVAMTMVVGMKFMVCSVEEKAEYKKTAIIYLAGALLIFVSTQIVKFIYKIFNS